MLRTFEQVEILGDIFCMALLSPYFVLLPPRRMIRQSADVIAVPGRLRRWSLRNYRRLHTLSSPHPQTSKETLCLRNCTRKPPNIMSRLRRLIGLRRSSTAVAIMQVASSNLLKPWISPRRLTSNRRRLTTVANSKNSLTAMQRMASTRLQVGAVFLFEFMVRSSAATGPVTVGLGQSVIARSWRR